MSNNNPFSQVEIDYFAPLGSDANCSAEHQNLRATVNPVLRGGPGSAAAFSGAMAARQPNRRFRIEQIAPNAAVAYNPFSGDLCCALFLEAKGRRIEITGTIGNQYIATQNPNTPDASSIVTLCMVGQGGKPALFQTPGQTTFATPINTPLNNDPKETDKPLVAWLKRFGATPAQLGLRTGQVPIFAPHGTPPGLAKA